MKSQTFKFFIDILMFIDFLIISISGFAGRGKSDIHKWASIILIVLLVIHLLMNYKWVIYMFKHVFGKGKIIDLR